MTKHSHRRAASERGFTLIELLVAVIAGLFVVTAAFLLSKGSTRVFASEARIALAQLNLRNGVDRLRTDLQRVSYMSSANGYADPLVCATPHTTWQLQGLRYVSQGSGTTAPLNVNNQNSLYPDAIYLQGNFASTDAYPTRGVVSTPGIGVNIVLQGGDPSVARMYAAGGAGESATDSGVAAAFPSQSLIRLTNAFGKSQYLELAGTGIDAFGNPTITTVLGNPPTALVDPSLAAVADPQCGKTGNGTGMTVNAVQMYKWWVGSMATNANFSWAYPGVGTDGGIGVYTDQFKTDLIRSQMPLGDTSSPSSVSDEIVSDYTVDLAFAFSYDTSLAPTGTTYVEPLITVGGYGDATGIILSGDASVVASGAKPERLRSVHFRVTTRNRETDRSTGLDDGGPGLARFGMPLYASGPMGYARARTVNGETALVNQVGLEW